MLPTHAATWAEWRLNSGGDWCDGPGDGPGSGRSFSRLLIISVIRSPCRMCDVGMSDARAQAQGVSRVGCGSVAVSCGGTLGTHDTPNARVHAHRGIAPEARTHAVRACGPSVRHSELRDGPFICVHERAVCTMLRDGAVNPNQAEAKRRVVRGAGGETHRMGRPAPRPRTADEAEAKATAERSVCTREQRRTGRSAAALLNCALQSDRVGCGSWRLASPPCVVWVK